MNRNNEVMKRAVELSETCLEGLEHVKSSLNKGHLETTMTLFHDTIEAFLKLQESINGFREKLPSNDLESLGDSLRNAFDHAVTAYEQGDRARVQEIMQFNLIPSYREWQGELRRSLKPYLEN